MAGVVAKSKLFDLSTTLALRATPPVPGACPSNAEKDQS